MTAMLHTPTRSEPAARPGRPSLARLTAVELRKLIDTRAGVWLLAAILLSCAAIVTVQLFTLDPETRRLEIFFLGTLLPIGILLPVLGILAVTSEWSQRTALTTFALVPVRSRVILGKLAAGAVVALGSLGVSWLVAAAANLVAAATGGDAGWEIGASQLGTAAVMQLINVGMGIGFGMLLLNTSLAIVSYFVLPILWTVLGEMISGLATTAQWLDFSITMAPILEGTVLTGQQWAQLGTTTAVWVAVPLLIGVLRVIRSEVP